MALQWQPESLRLSPRPAGPAVGLPERLSTVLVLQSTTGSTTPGRANPAIATGSGRAGMSESRAESLPVPVVVMSLPWQWQPTGITIA